MLSPLSFCPQRSEEEFWSLPPQSTDVPGSASRERTGGHVGSGNELGKKKREGDTGEFQGFRGDLTLKFASRSFFMSLKHFMKVVCVVTKVHICV